MSDLLRAGLVGSRTLPDPDLSATAHRRARVAQGMLALYVAVYLAALAMNALAPFRFERLTMALILCTFALTAVAFAQWQIAAYRLVPALSGAPTERPAWWAWGGWLIPFANLYVPYRVVSEIRDATDPAELDPGLDRVGPAIPLGAWWALWLAAGVSERIFGQIPEPEVAVGWTGYNTFAVVVSALWLGAAVSAALVVRGIDAGQAEVEALLAEGLEARSVEAHSPPTRGVEARA